MRTSTFIRLTAASALAALAGSAAAQCTLPGVITANNPAPEDYFGTALALDGNYMLVGANHRDINGNTDAGMVYTYAPVNGVWQFQTVLLPSVTIPGAYLGSAIGLGGGATWAVVGAWGQNNGNGAATFFHRDVNTGQWNQTQPFTQNFGPQSRFGQVVAMNKDATIAAISVPYADLTDASGTTTQEGRVLVYTRAGNTWTFERDLHQTNPALRHNGDIYGWSLAIDGNTLVVGASNASTAAHAQCGYVQVWTRDAQANWSTTAPIYSPEESTGGYFGTGVALKGNTLAVGSDGVQLPGMSFVGAAYIYNLVNGVWTYEAKVAPSNPINVQCFGGAMQIDSDRLVVGANNLTGRVYMFRHAGPGKWVQDSYFEEYGGYGGALALEGSNFVIGSAYEPVNGIVQAGSAFAFNLGGAPGSDSCDGATPVTAGTYQGCTIHCTSDGSDSCNLPAQEGPDIWFSYTAPATGSVVFDTQGSTLDTVLSVHAGCPGTTANSLACSDDFAAPQRWSKVTVNVAQGGTYLVRVAGYGGVTGAFNLNVSAVTGCYPNCDGSTTAPVLNVADFTCFLQKYAAGDPWANCDASVQQPTLNVADFTCFLQKYAAGCP